MTNGEPTTLDELLPLLTTQVATGISLDPAYVIPTLAEDFWAPSGLSDRYVLLSNFSGVALEGWVTGGGNAALAWMAELDVVLVNRLDIDSPGRDYQRLVNATLGLLPKWKTALMALSQWNPVAANGRGLLIQPARTLSFGVKNKKYPAAGGWIQIRTRLSLPFLQKLT